MSIPPALWRDTDPTNFTKQRAGKINVGMSIPPAFGGTKSVDYG